MGRKSTEHHQQMPQLSCSRDINVQQTLAAFLGITLKPVPEIWDIIHPHDQLGILQFRFRKVKTVTKYFWITLGVLVLYDWLINDSPAECEEKVGSVLLSPSWWLDTPNRLWNDECSVGWDGSHTDSIGWWLELIFATPIRFAFNLMSYDEYE